jgi:hypothetical protein
VWIGIDFVSFLMLLATGFLLLFCGCCCN